MFVDASATGYGGYVVQVDQFTNEEYLNQKTVVLRDVRKIENRVEDVLPEVSKYKHVQTEVCKNKACMFSEEESTERNKIPEVSMADILKQETCKNVAYLLPEESWVINKAPKESSLEHLKPEVHKRKVHVLPEESRDRSVLEVVISKKLKLEICKSKAYMLPERAGIEK